MTTTTAMVLYKPPARVRRVSPELEAFVDWIRPRFEAKFEEPTAGLIRETRAAFRTDREFRQLVKRGEKGEARKVLWEILCVLG
jgi:hypothetical protein